MCGVVCVKPILQGPKVDKQSSVTLHLIPFQIFCDFIYLYVSEYLPEYVCAQCMCSVHRRQKKALEPLGLELQEVVDCHVAAVSGTCVFWEICQCS